MHTTNPELLHSRSIEARTWLSAFGVLRLRLIGLFLLEAFALIVVLRWVTTAQNGMMPWITLLALLLLAVCGAASWWLSRPLYRLVEAAEMLAIRENAAPPPGTRARREIHHLSGVLRDLAARHDDEAPTAGDTAAFADRPLPADDAREGRLRFLAMISHEMDNPLTVIKNYALLLLAEDPNMLPAAVLSYAMGIAAETEALIDLSAQLQDAAQIERGTLRVAPAPTTLEQVIGLAAPRIAVLTEHHRVDYALPQDPVRLTVDAQRLAQVLGNLVSNAAKYSPAGTTITIRLKRMDQHLLAEVRDQGTGIPKGQRSRVFRTFMRGPALEQKGIGLGLAICKGIIEAHGGRIWVADHGDLPGTTIAFILPLHAPRADTDTP